MDFARTFTEQQGARDFAHVCKNGPVSVNRPTADNSTLSAVDPLADPDDLVRQYLAAARAPNTHRAYESDLRHFISWGGHIPSNAQEIARYLAAHASSLRPTTLRRRLSAIAQTHKELHHADPTKAELVRQVMQGVERKHGASAQQVAPLTLDHLATITDTLRSSLADIRDRAILLVGFFGALRRSEIAALSLDDLLLSEHEAVLRIARSKTDQLGVGRLVHLAARSDGLCPVHALRDWIAWSEIAGAFLFRRVDRGATQYGLCGRSIAEIVKRRVKAVGLPPENYSGHSLRSGFATTAALAGYDSALIARQTGHKTQQALAQYVRPSFAQISLEPKGASHCFLQDCNLDSFRIEQYALLRGLETPLEWNVAGHFGDALTHAVGEPVTYVQVSSDAKGHRDRLKRFSNSPITRDKQGLF